MNISLILRFRNEGKMNEWIENQQELANLSADGPSVFMTTRKRDSWDLRESTQDYVLVRQEEAVQ